MQRNIFSVLLGIFALMSIGFGAYEHQRVSTMEVRLEIFQTYHFKYVADRVKESPTGYQFSQLAERVENSPTTLQYLELQQQIKQNTDNLTGVRQDIKRIHPGGFFEADELAEGIDHWAVFIARVSDAEKLAEADPKTARILALGAFEGLGIRCRSRRLPLMAVIRVQPMVEDLYSFEPEGRRSDWVVVAGKNNGC